jgi:biotin carboxylase
MVSRRVLILAATRAYQLEDLVAAAIRLGLEPLIATDRCHVLAENWPDGAIPLDFRSPVRAARQLEDALGGIPLHGVVATDETTALIAAQVAGARGLPHGSIDAVAASADKRRFRQRMQEAGLPHPRFAVLEHPVGALGPGQDARAAAASIGYPVVVKPLHLSASRGVMRADDPAELDACVRRLARLLADPEVAAAAPDPDAAQHMLIEEFVPGPELALEGLFARGAFHRLALFDKPDPLDGPVFAETIYVTPSGISLQLERQVIAQVAAAARAIRLDQGPVHAEVRLPPDGPPVVLELAARSIGGLCGRVLRFGAGLSLEEVVLAHAVGADPGALSRAGAPAGGVMMLPVEQAGVLVSVDGVDQARAVAGVRDVVITARPGDLVVPLPEGHSYLGFLFADGERPDQVTRALHRAAGTLRWNIRRALR